jgi:hypothetical protein
VNIEFPARRLTNAAIERAFVHDAVRERIVTAITRSKPIVRDNLTIYPVRNRKK